MRIALLLIVSIVFINWTSAQTGPGGVGNSASNVIWLRSDAGTSTTVDNATVTTWQDQSGNAYHFAAPAATNEPTFKTNVLNGKSVLRFDGTQDFMSNNAVTSTFTNVSANNSYTFFTVGARKNTNANYFFGGDSAVNNKRVSLGWGSSTQAGLTQRNNNLFGNSNYSAANSFVSMVGVFDAAVGKEVYENGALIRSNTNTVGLYPYQRFKLANNQNVYYEVDIAEVIAYNTNVNDAQRIIVDNYLAAKYGLSISNDKYAYESGYSYEVAGIGQENASNTHGTAKGTNLFTVSSPSALSDADYLIWGHDNASIAAWTATGAPTNTKILSRVWRFDQTGDVGTVSINLDPASLPLRDATYSKYVLLVDADGNFSSGATIYGMSLTAANNIVAENVTIPDGAYVTIGELKPQIEFVLSATNGSESSLNPTFDVVLNYVADSNITCNYSVTGGTTNPADYTVAGSPLTITAGSQTVQITGLTVVDDATVEATETILLTLSGASGGVLIGTKASNTYSVYDNDGTRFISFSGSASSGSESTTNVSITVQVDLVDAGLPTTVDYTVTGSATGGGTDHNLASGTATIIANTLTTTINFTITNDLLNENNETIILTLSNPSSNVNIGANSGYAYTITDDDSEPNVEFTSSSSSGSESAGTVNFAVQLSSVSGRDITVNYTLSGSATNGGVDYTLNNGTITILAGNANATISADIRDDSDIETSENIILTLSGPSGATLGTNSTHTFTINDNDFFGYTGPGGVGDLNTNKVWLTADKGTSTTTDLDFVSTWNDQSGNALVASTAGTQRPQYLSSYLNNKPVIRFDGAAGVNGDYFDIDFSEITNSSYTLYTVGARRNTNANYFVGGNLTASPGGTGADSNLWIGWNSATQARISQRNSTLTGNSLNASSNTFVSMSTILDRTTGRYLYENGSLLNSNTNTNPLLYLGTNAGPPAASHYIGRLQNTYYEVDIAEVITYNAALGTTQKTIVDNYIAAKYNLTVSNDKYAYESTHPNEVAGIGRTSSSDMHTKAKGTSVILVENASNLANGDYLLWGHDGAATTWSTTEAPNGVKRIAREWRFDLTGTVGSIDITADLSGYAPFDMTYQLPVILIDADGDFSTGALVYELTDIGGDQFEISALTIPDGSFVTFGRLQPVVNLATSTSNVQENAGTVSIAATLNFFPASTYTVDYASTPVTATDGGVDYTLANGTLSFSNKDTIEYISPVIVDDASVEVTESFTVTISNPIPGASLSLGATTTHTVSILDNDLARKIEFADSTSTADESQTPALVTVTINSVDALNPTTADYTITGTAAGGGVDYTLAAGTVTIPAGSLSTNISIPVVDDALSELSETIIITLNTSSANANVGTISKHTYTIIDNDPTPTVQFNLTSSSGSEAVPSPTIQVDLSVASGQPVTVNYTVTGTASGGGVDYILANGTLTIAAGFTSGTISPTIIDDGSIESPETIIIEISSPSGATLGTITQHTFTILDDNTFGYTGPGGVGDDANIFMWLMADEIASNPTNGSNVSTWDDKTTNGTNATSPSSSNEPLYVTNVINSKPVLRFDGTNDYMDYDGSSFLNSPYSSFVVGQRRTATTSYLTGNLNNTNNSSVMLGWSSATNVNFTQIGTNINAASASTGVANVPTIFQGIYDPGNGRSFYENGNLIGTSVNTTPNSAYTGTKLAYYNTNYYDCDIAEVFNYNANLNTTQFKIVNTYLAAKYGISIPAGVNKFSYASSHPNQVAGIGQESSSDYHTKAKGRGAITISNASGLANSEYMVWGHDNAGITSYTTTEAPTDVMRITREWRFDQNGDVGSVTVALDTTGFGTCAAGYPKKVILIDADGDFSSGASIVELVYQSGTEYAANNITIPDGYYVTFGCIAAKVQFTVSSSSGFEYTTSPTAQLTLNYTPSANITVNYSSAAGTATAASDYSDVSGTATIAAGSTTANITLAVINDVAAESSENFTITLSAPSAGVVLGTNTVHTYTINDDDQARQISFATATGTADESFSPVSVTVNLNLVDGINPTTVDYTVTGTATGAGTDYTLANGTLTIAANQTTGTISIPIINDLISEGSETIILALSNPTNGILGSILTYTYTIVDNDANPTVSFASSTSSISEALTPATIPVQLSAASGQNITVNYTLTGTATGGGVDYTLAAGTLTINAGATTANISATIINDALTETSETIILTLSSPSGATLGAITSHTLTVSDDDYLGYTGPGGVGDVSSNILWLDADSGATASYWPDRSGNGVNAFQGNAAQQPAFNTGVVASNNKPFLRFDNTTAAANDDRMWFNYKPTATIANTPFTIFYVGARRTAGVQYFLGDTTNSASNGIFSGWDNGSGDTRFALYDNVATPRTTATAGEATTNVFNIFTGYFDVTTGKGISINNGTYGTSTNNTPLTSAQGFLAYNQGACFNVDIAEVIQYNKYLNSAQIKIVNNYLASKYNKTLNANDYFAYDATFGYGVIGIGRDNSSNIHTTAKGRGNIKLSNANSLGDGDYLLLGNDNGALTYTSTGAPAGGDFEISTRKWQFDETNSVGTITLDLDTLEFTNGRNSTFYKYGVILSTDNDFTTTADQTVYELVFTSGSTFEANNVTIGGDKYMALVRFTPRVNFDYTASQGLETDTPDSLGLTLNYVPCTNVTVNYTLTGTATSGGTDYTSGTTVTINAGTTTANLSLTVVADAVSPEANETVIFTFAVGTGYSAGASNSHTYTIIDVPTTRYIDFVSTSSSADESFTSINVQVQISVVDAINPTTVDYTITGTATGGGTDYTLVNGTATIPAGSTTVNINIPIINDVLDEVNETIILTLSNPINASLGTNTVHTYTILDNDNSPSITFDYSSSSGAENNTPATITLSLSAVSGQNVTVNYTVTGGSASGAGVDYTLVSGTVIINAGSTTGSFDIAIQDEVIVENPETIVITLSNPSGATLGTITAHTFTILDDDFFGWTGPGGVGSSSNNRLWLMSDKGTSSTTHGSFISQWNDYSGNGNNATQATSTNRPTYLTNMVNGKPVLSFDGTTDRMDYIGSDLAGSAYTTIFVGARRNNTSGDLSMVFGGNHTNNQSFRFGWTGSNQMQMYARSRFSTTAALSVTSTNVFGLFTGTYNAATKALFENGTAMSSLNNNGQGAVNIQNYSPAYIGYDANGGYAELDLAEAIQYNASINTTQRNIVENYLAAKYNLSISNDYYTYQTTHPNDVAGIGQVSSADYHTVAQGPGMVKISNASGLSDGEYLIWGHDNADSTALTATDAPTDTRRIAREWRFDQTGSVGTVSLTVRATSVGTNASYPKFICMIDADGTFSSGATLYEMSSTGGGWYTLNGLTIPDGSYITFGWIAPKVQFTNTTTTGTENTSPATVAVSLNYIPCSSVTVDFTSTGVTATGGGVDYTLANGTLTIPSGSSSANISVTLINDVIAESSESFTITLSNPIAGVSLGTNTTNTFTINDDDNARLIEFTSYTSTGGENVVNPTITVQLSAIDVVNPTTVDYTLSGTATGGGVDYILTAGTITIPAGSLTATVSPTIINDAIYESSETIILTLTNPTNANMGTKTTHTYTIIDNDAMPTVAFNASSSNGSESVGSVDIQVDLSAASGSNVTVNYSVSSGTATGGGVDYTLASGTVSITAGLTSSTFPITLINDGNIESNETVVITLSTPSGSSLGATTTHTFTIVDDDYFGYTGPGGVGDATLNSVWFRADKGTSTTTNGANNNGWTDQSGNGNNAASAAGNEPTYQANVINSLPALRFSTTGTDDYMTYTFGGTSGIANSSYTLISVAARRADAATYIFGGNTGTNYYDARMGWNANVATNPNVIYTDRANSIQGYSSSAINTFGIMLGRCNTLAGKALYLNGTLLGTSANTNPLTQFTSPSICRNGTGATGYDADVAEAIVYRAALNTAQQRIVENYLSSKYAITTANDYYAHDVAGNNFRYEVAGIGQYSATEYHNLAQGTGLVRIGSPSALSSGDYLLWGHDNKNVNAWISAGGNTPTGDTSSLRVQRIWKVDHTNNVGTVTMTIDVSTFPAMPSGKTGYYLVVDVDTNFITTANRTVYPFTQVSGNTYQATGVTLTDNYYFTIGVGRNVSIITGNFNTASNWLLGYVPTSTETATIGNGTTITLTTNHQVGGVQINSGGTLSLGSNTLTLNTGTLTNNGTFNAGTGTVSFANTSGTQCIQGLTYNVTYYNLQVINAGTKNLCDSIKVTGNLTLGSATTTLNTQGYKVYLQGNLVNSVGTLTTTNSTFIFTGTTTISAAATFTNMWIKSTKSLTLPAATTTINGYFKNDGTLSNGNGSVTFTGNDTIYGSSTSTFNNVTISNSLTAHSTNMGVNGNFVNNGTFNHNSGTVTFGGNTTISGPSLNTFNNVTINTASTLVGPSGNLTIVGNWTNTGTGVFNGTSNAGTIVFNGNTTMSGTGISTFYNINVLGTLSASTHDFIVQNNWNSSAGTFNEGTAKVTFSGTVATPIITTPAAGELFYKVTLNKTAGTLTLASSASRVTVLNALTMTSGNLNQNGGLIFLGDTIGLTGCNLSRTTGILYNGKVWRYLPAGAIASSGATNYGLFPIGDTLNNTPVYRPFALDGSITTGGLIFAKHTNLRDATDIVIDSAGVSWVNQTANQNTEVGYPTYVTALQLAKLDGNGNNNVMAVNLTGKATFSNIPSLGSSTLGHIRAVINDSCKANFVATTGTVSNPTVSRAGLNRNGVKGIWKPGTTNKTATPLPVEMLTFKGEKIKDNVILYWETLTEKNNKHFEIQRSADGKRFDEIGIVKGSGTTSNINTYEFIDSNPIKGINYYRLKQVDFDGKFELTNVIKVEFEDLSEPVKPIVKVFPNPAEGNNFKLEIENFNEEVLVVLRDISGKEVFAKVLVSHLNNSFEGHEINNVLPPGIYLITASSNNLLVSERLIVK